MHKIGILGLYGNSGKKYQFEIHRFGTELEEIPSVYAVTRRYLSEDDEYRHIVIYIGRTDNLARTFENHKSKSCFRDNDANCLCILMDDNLKSRTRTVKDLVDRIKPKCNELHES